MKTRLIALLSAIVLLLSGFMLYGTLNGELTEAEIKAQFTELKSDYEHIQKDLEMAITDTDFRTEEILEQKKRIETLLEKNAVTEEELYEAKNIMRTLSQKFLKHYQNKVSVLETEKKQLKEEKDTLVTATTGLKKKILDLQQERSREKIILEKKDQLISYAAKLNLSNFILKGFKVRDSGKEIETEKASRIERIKVLFDVNENLLSESGRKTIYMVIRKPSGEVVRFTNKPTETFVYNNQKFLASDKLTFNYQKDRMQTLEFVWDSEDFARGAYVMEIFELRKNNIVLIGKATKTLN